jgi:hypothetical protein
LGLGKAVSHGFGVVAPLIVKEDKKKRTRLKKEAHYV